MFRKHYLPFVLGLSMACACCISAAAVDGLHWDNTIGQPGMDYFVRVLAAFDDGTGPALLAGGSFTSAGGSPVNRIAKWDGSQWSPLGAGVNGWVLAFVAFDDGTGHALYAGGSFTAAGGGTANRVARWDGSGWSPLGKGMNNNVQALAVFDDGTGPALYAGGGFTTAGGQPANRVAKWDGSQWSRLGEGMNFGVEALTVFDDGTGPALYAAGAFTAAGGQPASRIAKWDGSQWSPLGEGVIGVVRALVVFDDGTGPALYAGGFFTAAGGQPANSIAKWDGSQWSPLGDGVSGGVSALAVFHDGAGPALFVGGGFTSAGSRPARRIASWDGSAWSLLLSGLNEPVRALGVFDDGTGAGLYAGGDFTLAGGKATGHIAAWRGCAPPTLSIHVPRDYPTIQAAIDSAKDGHEVIVAPGVYQEVIDFLGKTIRLRSSGGAEVTVIDAQGKGSVVTCASGEGSCTVLEGFTITGGTGTLIEGWHYGGGILVDGATLRVEHCIIADNHVTAVGGGIYGAAGVLYVSDTRIEGNSASMGGGVQLRNVYADVVRCRFEANAAIGSPSCVSANDGLAGGLGRVSGGVTSQGWAHVVECTFEGNTATNFGGAVVGALLYDEPMHLDDCLFVANTAHHGGALANGSNTPPLIVTNSVFLGNDATGCSQSEGGAAVSATGPVHLIGCAFRGNTAVRGGALRIVGLVESCTFESNSADNGGAIDATSSFTQFGIGNSFFCGNEPNHIAGIAWVDHGGNEFNDTCLPDLNGDGVVDVQDLLILLAAWGPCPECFDCPADLNGDCSVDVLDLLILLANWG